MIDNAFSCLGEGDGRGIHQSQDSIQTRRMGCTSNFHLRFCAVRISRIRVETHKDQQKGADGIGSRSDQFL